MQNKEGYPQETQKNKKQRSRATGLILLCWAVYTCSYIGKLGYTANIHPIGDALGMTYGEAGTISTFFFFAYGAGQVVNGLLCKRYNVKYVIFGSLLLASLMNLLMIVVPTVAALKYIWLTNGVAMSFLWTSLIRLLSETISKKEYSRAILAMGTTVATGTFLVYGMSALFAAVASYHLIFAVAVVLLLLVAFLWIVSYDRLVTPLKAERAKEITQEAEEGAIREDGKRRKRRTGFVVFLLMFMLFAVMNNFVKDGLITWTPDILDALYGTPEWLSILLTLFLPVLSIFGTGLAVNLHKRVRGFDTMCMLLFGVCAILIAGIIGLLSFSAIAPTVACLGLVACLMASVNSTITSMMPFHLSDQIDAGKLAGTIDGCCYLGSAISSFGLGMLADCFGWNAVFSLLLAVCCTAVLLGCMHVAVRTALAKRSKKQKGA